MSDLTPRKQPQQERSRATVDAIFEAMLDVLERQEVDNPAVQLIADRAGVSVGSVYQYFPTKGALTGALLRHHLKQQMDGLEKDLAAASSLSGEDAAVRLVDSLLDNKRKRSRVEGALMRYFIRVGDLATLTEMDSRMLALVEAFLTKLGPQLRPVNPAIAAFIISNALRSAVLLSLMQKPERLNDPEFRSELIRLVVSYLSPQR